MVMKTLLTVSIATADMSVYIGIFVYYTRKLEISLLMASESFGGVFCIYVRARGWVERGEGCCWRFKTTFGFKIDSSAA